MDPFSGASGSPTPGTNRWVPWAVGAAVLAVVALGVVLIKYAGPNGGGRRGPSSDPVVGISSPTTCCSPLPPTPTKDPAKYDKTVLLEYIDNDGHIDFDQQGGPRLWNGDNSNNDDSSDVVIGTSRIAPEGSAEIARSNRAGKSACQDAVAHRAINQISMANFRSDGGMYAVTGTGSVIWVRYGKLLPAQGGDHSIRIEVVAYK
jgi:hypothetical protein